MKDKTIKEKLNKLCNKKSKPGIIVNVGCILQLQDFSTGDVLLSSKARNISSIQIDKNHIHSEINASFKLLKKFDKRKIKNRKLKLVAYVSHTPCARCINHLKYVSILMKCSNLEIHAYSLYKKSEDEIREIQFSILNSGVKLIRKYVYVEIQGKVI